MLEDGIAAPYTIVSGEESGGAHTSRTIMLEDQCFDFLSGDPALRTLTVLELSEERLVPRDRAGDFACESDLMDRLVDGERG